MGRDAVLSNSEVKNTMPNKIGRSDKHGAWREQRPQGPLRQPQTLTRFPGGDTGSIPRRAIPPEKQPGEI